MVTIYDADGKHFVIVTLKGRAQSSKHTDARALCDYATKVLNKNNDKEKTIKH